VCRQGFSSSFLQAFGSQNAYAGFAGMYLIARM
jgi:hypothetical protein